MNTTPLRAAGRIAWRGARRNVRRSVLVVTMVALPVALVTATGTVARTTMGTPEGEASATMGSADLLLSLGKRFDRDGLLERLPSGSQAVAMRTEDVGLVQQGELLYSTLVEFDQDMGHPVLQGMHELERGRAPQLDGEAALSESFLRAFDAEIGSRIDAGEHRLTVTGVVRTRDLDHLTAVVGPMTLEGFSPFSTVMIDLPSGVPPDLVRAQFNVHGVTTRDEVEAMAARDATTWDAVAFVGGILALFATGLIAAAAFVVGARRQLRELGLVGAVGGERRHVRAVVWLGGTTLGLVGGILGSLAGIGLAAALHPFLDRFVGRAVGPLSVNLLLVVAVILMGTAAATLAALAPARAAGRLSVMEALGGRTPLPRPPGRVAARGLVVLVLGTTLTAGATYKDEDELLAAGLVVMLLGILFAIPLLIALTGRVAHRLPTTARLAARDAARHGRKTGAAVAAAVVALAVPVAVSAYSLSEERYERLSRRLGDEQLLIGRWDDVATDSAPDEVAADVGAAFAHSTVVPLAHATARRSPGGRPQAVFAFGVKEDLGDGEEYLTAWELFVGDADLLQALDAEEGLNPLREGDAVVLGGYETHKGFVRLQLPSQRAEDRGQKLPATTVDSPAYFNESIPRVVISPKTARRLSLDSKVSEYLFAAPAPLSPDDVTRAREVVAHHPGFFVMSGEDYLPKYRTGRTAATAASVPLALAVLAVAVALVVSESRRSHQILVAIGAGPITHRKVVAATSTLLAFITALLAIPAGLWPTVVVQLSSQTDRPVAIPWLTIAIILICAPVLAGAVGGFVARSPKLGSLLNPAT